MFHCFDQINESLDHNAGVNKLIRQIFFMNKFDDPLYCPDCGLFYFDDPEDIKHHRIWHDRLVDGTRYKNIDDFNYIYRGSSFVISLVEIYSSHQSKKKIIQEISSAANKCIKAENQLFTYHPYIINQGSHKFNERY